MPQQFTNENFSKFLFGQLSSAAQSAGIIREVQPLTTGIATLHLKNGQQFVISVTEGESSRLPMALQPEMEHQP